MILLLLLLKLATCDPPCDKGHLDDTYIPDCTYQIPTQDFDEDGCGSDISALQFFSDHIPLNRNFTFLVSIVDVKAYDVGDIAHCSLSKEDYHLNMYVNEMHPATKMDYEYSYPGIIDITMEAHVDFVTNATMYYLLVETDFPPDPRCYVEVYVLGYWHHQKKWLLIMEICLGVFFVPVICVIVASTAFLIACCCCRRAGKMIEDDLPISDLEKPLMDSGSGFRSSAAPDPGDMILGAGMISRVPEEATETRDSDSPEDEEEQPETVEDSSTLTMFVESDSDDDGELVVEEEILYD